ncbi:hypothetical protein H2203_006961 [Taxawa tesnikishii (nom. ined.)]|nr:hypothetical protein H2203_006961 [Dothideales sp. JES 119]
MHFTKLCVVLGAAATVLASPFDRLHLHKKARSTKVVTLTSIVTPVEAESPTAYSSASNTSVSVNPYGTWNVSDTTTSTTAGALLETSAEATPSSTGLSVAITTASDGMVNAVAQRPSTVTRVTTTTLTYTMGAGATTTVKTTEYEHTITEWATEYITIFLTSLQPAQVTSAAVAQAASSAAGAPAYTTIESSLYAMVTSSLAALDSSASASAYGTAAYAQPASSSSEASVGSVSTSAETSAAVTASSAVSIDTSGEAESTSIAPYGSASTTSSSSATQSSDTTFCPSLNVQTYSDESGVDYKIGCNINYDGTVTVGKSVYRRATSSSLADCLAECDATNDCVGTAFENDACTLYSSIGQPYLDSGVEFAVRLSARQSSTDTSAPSYTPSAYTNGSVAESSAVSFNQTSGAAIATGIPSPVAGTTSAPVLAPTTVTFWTTTLITVTKWGPKWGIGKPGATSVITRSVPVTTTITPSATAAPAATVEPATITVWTTTLVTVTDYAQGIPATPDYTDCPASATAVVTKSIPVSTTVVSQSTVTSATISQGSSAAAAQSSGAQSSYSPAVNATSIASATIAASSTTGSNFTATVALASCTSTDVCPSCAGAGVSAGDQTYKIACDVSGAGQELDTTYVSKRGLSVDSFQACLEHCSLSDECVGFAFVVESSECTLFSAITGGSKMSGVQLGFVPARLAYDALRVLDDLIEEVVEGQQYSSSFVSSTTASSTIILTPYSSSSASTAAALSSPVPANGTSAVTLSSLSQSFPAKAISYHTRTTTSFTTSQLELVVEH